MDKQELIRHLHNAIYFLNIEGHGMSADHVKLAIAALSEPALPELPQDIQFVVDWLLHEAETLGDGCDGDTAKRAARLIQAHAQREAAHAAELASVKEQGRREALAQVSVGALGVAQCALTAASGEDNLPAADRLQISYALADIAKLLDSARASQEAGL